MQIPQGWGVSYNIYLTHLHDDKIEDKEGGGCMDLKTAFRPERWLDPATRPGKLNYIPFGVGPRRCPGGLLAMAEQKVFLALLARAFPKYELEMEIDPTKSIEDQIGWKKESSMLTPEDGVPIRILQYNSQDTWLAS